MEQPRFNLLGELKKIYVKITLLQSLHYVPIYVETVRDLIIKKLGRKPKDPPTVHVVGNLSELMMGRAPLDKYDDPGNPIVTISIGNSHIHNILVDVGTSINIMTIETVKKLELADIKPTPSIL